MIYVVIGFIYIVKVHFNGKHFLNILKERSIILHEKKFNKYFID